ncbi:glycosyltransferase family 2 protein [Cognatiyoonia sp. IB215182]|uniref:glycosyltransferase n=1 Tax=Cognatiyoonia sp. IB215182 TaxID=3097353 RepID=UPI002A129EC3|nr:glycosyltransferase family 2 protein [Cognatiyoonia sp. IB215182]MDX8353077.1 glycosyltransferase family 2 protein [Cognatiyoonia sp. IB215182]
MLSVIIPSNNEESCIQTCLDAIVAQTDLPDGHDMQVIVAANGCTDQTVSLAQAKEVALKEAGFDLLVLDIPVGNKMNALNEGDAVARHAARVYLDADIVISPRVLTELSDLLSAEKPVYASGAVRVPRSKSLISRAYAKVWTSLPFVRDGVPGIGLYAVNGSGRARWAEFPKIYGDDRFVRLQFKPHERLKTKATYDWPLPEGFANLVHVRHRWREGNVELAEAFPELEDNDSEFNKSFSNMLRLLKTPFSSAVFVTVYLVSNARARRSKARGGFVWRRGR